jgi:hypothetical protein
MPEVSRFYGIVIRIYFGDHPPPHFHAAYGEHQAKVDIERKTIIDGKLPARAQNLVLEWTALRQAELCEAFRKAANMEPPGKIEPLS